MEVDLNNIENPFFTRYDITKEEGTEAVDTQMSVKSSPRLKRYSQAIKVDDDDKKAAIRDLDEVVQKIHAQDMKSPSPWDPERDGDLSTLLESMQSKAAESAREDYNSVAHGSTTSSGIIRETRSRANTLTGRDNSFVNNEYCEFCGPRYSGDVVCCEGCPNSFHFLCAEPPVDREKVGSLEKWYCKSCRAERFPPSSYSYKGPFKELLMNIERMNPVSFSLPEGIKKYFEGVSWTDSGVYVDTSESKVANKGRTDTELFRLVTEEGKPIHCHKCGGTGLNGPIISCDSCPLFWHLDCLSPPLTAPVPANKKWTCPAHADDLLVKKRKVAGQTIDVLVTDPAFKNDGDVEIILEPYPNNLAFERSRRVNYRLPETSIKLNFIQKNNEEKTVSEFVTAPTDIKKHYGPASTSLKRNLDVPDAEASGTTPEDAKDWLVGLCHFYSQVDNIVNPNSDAKLRILYEAALGLNQDFTPDIEISEDDGASIGVKDPLFQQFLAWKQLRLLQEKYK